MSDAKHTPGPWTQWKDHAAVFAGVEENERGTLSGKHLVEICRCEGDDVGEDDDEGEAIAKANARLIAAAPDLLAACEAHHEYMLDLCGGKVDTSALHPNAIANWESIRAAIAKAKGTQS